MATYTNSRGEAMTGAAFHALMAARMRQQIGRYAAMRYALRHGSTLALYRLACQLQAAASN